MSLMHPYVVADGHGQRHAAMLADCLNIQRMPAARDQILARQFHQVSVASVATQVEKSFFYLDLPRGQALLVQPPRDRARHREASMRLDRMLAVLPAAMRANAHQVRVVYGIEELREKLVAADAGFDDRAVELMKAAVLHDHPVLLGRPRLRLSLDAVDSRGAHFLAAYDHSPKAYRVSYASPEGLLHDEPVLKAWSANLQRHDLYALPARAEHWVNYRRWVPSHDAMADLRALVQELAAGRPPAPRSKAFKSLLMRLPRGSALSGQAKQDLRRLFEWAKGSGQAKLQDQLFELRFSVALDDAWYRNHDPDDIATLWTLLKNLPDAHVEGNSKLAELNLGAGGGGTYSPSAREIEIGLDELAFKERFEDTLRHEVGHAVHESRTKLVDDWLWQRFGWAEFAPSVSGVADWAALMGPKAGWAALSTGDKAQVRSLLEQACGPRAQWGPTVTPAAPASSPWRGAGFGPRLAFERSGARWWEQQAQWYRAQGKAFAINFWYGSLMCVNETTLDLVARRMPDAYAAMSPAEFFAEVYALHYDADDPQRPGLPADVRRWLDQQLGAAELSQPARPAGALSSAGRKPPVRRAKPALSRPTSAGRCSFLPAPSWPPRNG